MVPDVEDPIIMLKIDPRFTLSSFIRGRFDFLRGLWKKSDPGKQPLSRPLIHKPRRAVAISQAFKMPADLVRRLDSDYRPRKRRRAFAVAFREVSQPGVAGGELRHFGRRMARRIAARTWRNA